MASSECRGESTTRMRKRPRTFFCGHCNKEVSKATFYRHRTDVYKQEWQGKPENNNNNNNNIIIDIVIIIVKKKIIIIIKKLPRPWHFCWLFHIQVPGKLGEKVLVLPPWMALILAMVCLKCFQLFYDVYI